MKALSAAQVGFRAGVFAGAFLLAASAFAQSLGEVARQDRERRQRTPCVSRVLTNEDLERPRILDAKDRACLESAREAARPSEDAAPVLPQLDTDIPLDSRLPNFPLADIAPYDRAMKEARRAKQDAARWAELARQRKPTPRVRARGEPPGPAPGLPVQAGITPDLEAIRALRAVRKRKPQAPPSVKTRSAPATHGAARIRVAPGDSLWKLAAQHLGHGARWRELAAVNPQISNPDLIRVGDLIQLPSEISNLKSQTRSLNARDARDNVEFSNALSITVERGDTLWALARAEFGRGAAWTCIAQANPQLSNPHLIFPGQTLALPPACPATP